jgi:predicted ATPase
LKREDTDSQNVSVNAALEAYIETLETKNEERQLISSRLKKFEQLISKFIKDKSIYIDYSTGLTIKTCSGEKITELELSSGEYHLLYMMVTALVSTSTGTTIAIDEPELSLHISWQRDLIKTLASCSFGASPLLIFATHSAAISAEYYDKCVRLG